MYIDGWDEFSFRAKELFLAHPDEVRYTFKYHHSGKKLVVKITDNRVCLKYKTDQLGDVKKLDKLNTWFMKQSLNESPTMLDDEEMEVEIEQKKVQSRRGKKRR